MKRAKKYPFYVNLSKRISLYIENHSHCAIPDKNFLFKVIRKVSSIKNFKKILISIIFCDMEKARYYNHKFRKKDYATNILSFSFNDDIFIPQNELAGDLIVCSKIIEQEAIEQQKTIQSHYAHIIIHGMLHLMGFDHIDDKNANIMESIEIKLMQELGFNNPYN